MNTGSHQPAPGQEKDSRNAKLSQNCSNTSPLKKFRDRNNGKTAQTARWTEALLKHPNQTQFLVHRRGQEPPSRWQRCTLGEASYEAEAGYSVWELSASQGKRINLLKSEPQQQWESAIGRQLHEVEEEEAARIVRHQHLASDDLMEDFEEENEEQDERVFDE